MDNLSYQYLDHNFSPDKADRYTLLLQCDSTRFSFAVAEKKKLILLSNHLSWDVLADAPEDSLLLKSYGKCIIGLPYASFTLVPVSLFNPEKVADFARFLDVKAGEKVCSQPLDNDNHVIFKVCSELLDKIAGRFDLKDIVFAPKGWILAITESGPSNNDLYLNIIGETVEILNFKDGKLRYYNSFGFENEDELAYFVTIATGELQLEPESVNLVISGEAELSDQNCNRLQYFFGDVGMNPVKALTLPRQFTVHTCLSLTALSLCGSSAEN